MAWATGDYTTLAAVKRRIGNEAGTDDDALIEDLITEQSRWIDTYCGRKFYRFEETRSYHAVEDVLGDVLELDEDLIGVITLTNGDSEVIPASAYVLLEANFTPKWAVQLLSSSGYSWDYGDDPEEAISLNGTWGYYNGTMPEKPLQHATERLVAWKYYQRSAPFETMGLPDMGKVIIPTAIPVDIKTSLEPFRRHSFGDGF